jgi:hypothetical protein
MNRLTIACNLIVTLMIASSVTFFTTVSGTHTTSIQKAVHHKHVTQHQKTYI